MSNRTTVDTMKATLGKLCEGPTEERGEPEFKIVLMLHFLMGISGPENIAYRPTPPSYVSAAFCDMK